MSESGRRDKEQGDESGVVEQFFTYYVAEIKKRDGRGFCQPCATNRAPPKHYGMLTTLAHKPSIVIEQATSSYSFRFSELSQPI